METEPDIAIEGKQIEMNKACKVVAAECIVEWILEKMIAHFQPIDLAASGMLDLSHEPTLDQLQLKESIELVRRNMQVAHMVLGKVRQQKSEARSTMQRS